MNGLPRFVVFFCVLASAFAHGAESYFPPPESAGGWRALVPVNATPSAEQKQAVRDRARLDWDKLAEAWRYTASFKTPNTLLIIRHGWIAGEWMNYTNARGIASCNKSLTALAMAKLFDLSDAGQLTKRIRIDDEAWRFLPADWAEAEPARKQIRLRHLLTMTSGLTPYDGPYKADYLDQVFAQKVEAPPGTVWAYASVPVDMLSLILENVSGRELDQFFNQEINAAIGAAPVKWGQFSGHAGGSGGPQGGARFPARELARVGYLALHHGTWEMNGQRRQVIQAKRIDAFTHREPALEKTTWRQPNFAFEPQANRYYGRLWWNNHTGQGLGNAAPRDAFYMSGWGKQACFVVPSLDMVVVRLGPDKSLNEHPEYYHELWKRLMAAVVKTSDAQSEPAASAPPARVLPFDGQTFRGRIAYSCDGNHNDRDDWIASPMTLAILAAAGVKEQLVHFDYNSILPRTDTAWEKTHAESVLGAAERFGFDRSRFFDCRKDLDAAVASIAKAINDSTALDPLYFIVAGPMKVPYLGIRKSDPARRRFVYCISHSRWNDGFASKYKFSFTKRSVIEQDVHWVQIRDQNRLLSFGRYGRAATPEEFAPYFWMRDSGDANIRWLWERMLVSTRPDPSDAGMTWFLVTGDEACDPAKLKRLLADHALVPQPTARRVVRLEAENFRHFEGCTLEDRNDPHASHRLNTKRAGATAGSIRTPFDEPFTQDSGRYDAEVRYFDVNDSRARLALFVNGVAQGAPWESPATAADG